MVVSLASLTRDVANTELRLGHSDGCSLEHERLRDVKSVEEEVNGRSEGKSDLACERAGMINRGYVSIQSCDPLPELYI